jgi:hypothetical protein
VVRRIAVALAWLAAAAVIALGAAGIVAALDHLPGSAGRPELTATADRAVTPALDAATADLQALADAVGVLGDDGRAALAALVARDAASLDDAIARGRAQLDAIDAAAAKLAAAVAVIPLADPDRVVRSSAGVIARYEALRGALAADASLRPAWERLAAGVAPAVELTDHLLEHDRIAGEAIQLGGAGDYRRAIATIDRASAELGLAREIRDDLAASVDVTTLDQWIARNAAYDDALRDLWDGLRRSNGRATDAVREAAERERVARDQLPVDARALTVILGDVARGGLNQAVITVEEVRGQLLDAYAAALGAPSIEETPSGPSPSPAP